MYIYNPNVYNEKKIKEKNLSEKEFLSMQLKYRESFEKLLMKKYNFQEIDQKIKEKHIDAKLELDKEYNFYHKFSNLKSNYLFFRNNYHIEDLDEDEIQYIKKCILENTLLSNDFIVKTSDKVLFPKKNGQINYNYNSLECFVPAKSFVFEFAYDLDKCTSIKEMQKLRKIGEEEKEKITACFSPQLNVPISFIVYNATPDIFKTE